MNTKKTRGEYYSAINIVALLMWGPKTARDISLARRPDNPKAAENSVYRQLELLHSEGVVYVKEYLQTVEAKKPAAVYAMQPGEPFGLPDAVRPTKPKRK